MLLVRLAADVFTAGVAFLLTLAAALTVSVATLFTLLYKSNKRYES